MCVFGVVVVVGGAGAYNARMRFSASPACRICLRFFENNQTNHSLSRILVYAGVRFRPETLFLHTYRFFMVCRLLFLLALFFVFLFVVLVGQTVSVLVPFFL